MRRATVVEVLPFIARAAKFDTTGGDLDIQEIANNGHRFVFESGGQMVLGYTVEPRGNELWITAAAGRADIDLTSRALAAIEAQAKGFVAIVFETVRPGLVRKAESHGYEVSGIKKLPGHGYIMRKAINQ